MNLWSVPESLVHLGVMLGILSLIPLLRRWVGGPLWTCLAIAAGFLVLIGAESRRLVLALSEGQEFDQAVWISADIQAVGYVVVMAGFVIWVRHLRKARTELSHAAATDPLTHLSNRRQALGIFQHEIERARRSGSALSVIMIDLDHLKPINDRLGHLAGDAVLRHIGLILKGRMRAADIVARYGGDEFMVVLPEAGSRAALHVAVDLRRALNETPAVFGNFEIPLMASFGITTFDIARDTAPEDLIARADEAMYFVKRSGGNSIADWAGLERNQANEALAAPAAAPSHA